MGTNSRSRRKGKIDAEKTLTPYNYHKLKFRKIKRKQLNGTDTRSLHRHQTKGNYTKATTIR